MRYNNIAHMNTIELQSNNHFVFLLYYHLVLVVKYRRKIFNDERFDFTKKMFSCIGSKYGIRIVEWNHDVDHIHVVFTAEPKSELTHFINSYKAVSSRLLKKEFPEIRSVLWQEMLWSRSFCLLTTGGATIDVIKGYIESQGNGISDHRFAGHIKTKRLDSL
jgi:putative transposase